FSNKPKLLYNYFKQNFAQVTNPPIDPIREELVMSLISMIGPRPNLRGHAVGTHHRLEVARPILTVRDLAKIRSIEQLIDGRFKTDTLDITWPAAEGAAGIAPALDRLCREATAAVEAGHNILILSDRAVSAERVPIPALLATSAVHHHLIRQGQRTKTGDVVEKYFTGTATTIEGADLKAIAEEALVRHARAFGDDPLYTEMLDLGGDYAFRLRGEAHAWTPQSVAKLQHAVRGNSLADYQTFAQTINDQTERLLTIRGLMKFKLADQPIPLDEVEPAVDIVRRFATGAMSFGSISREAHTTLAIAMNRIGGKSNTGEGGEEASRFKPL